MTVSPRLDVVGPLFEKLNQQHDHDRYKELPVFVAANLVPLKPTPVWTPLDFFLISFKMY